MHRRPQRALRPRAARGAAERPDDLGHPREPATTRSTSSGTARSRRPTSSSGTTGTCCRSSSASSARSAGASTSRARWWTRACGRLARERDHPAAGARRPGAVDPAFPDGPARRRRTSSTRESLTQPMLDFLKAAVACRLNMHRLGRHRRRQDDAPERAVRASSRDNERIVTIEDAAELMLRQRHVVRLETRPSNIEGKGSDPPARSSSSTPSACAPIASSSARCAATRRSTCCRP